MTSSTQGMTLLRQRMLDDMRMRKLSAKTQSGYIRAVRQFTGFLGRSPDTASIENGLERSSEFLPQFPRNFHDWRFLSAFD